MKGLAVGEEGVGYYLCRLPSSGIVAPPEVWAVLTIARLAWPPAPIAADYTSARLSFYGEPEGVRGGHIRVSLPAGGDWVVIARGVGDYLAYLASGGAGRPPEVWAILAIARLAWPSAVVPAYVSSA